MEWLNIAVSDDKIHMRKEKIMQDKKENNTPKKESVKSLGKLINIMVWDDLCENMDGLSEAEIIDHLIENYELDGAANLERRGIETKSRKTGNSKQANPVRQSIRGQVRRTLEALSNIDAYLDIEGTGNTKAEIFRERYGVEIKDGDEDEYGNEKCRKIYKLFSTKGRDAHKLTDNELRTLMFLVRVNQALSVEQTKAVITKLIQYGSKDFRKEMGFSFAAEDFHSGGGTAWDKELVAPNYVMKNVELLQDVINQNRVAENNRKAPKLNVEFTFYAYDEKKRLRPSEEILGKAEFRRIVTPLKVFSDNGKLYVYVAWERGKKKENKNEEKNKKPWSFSTYRIDLMRELVKRNIEESGGKVYVPGKEQREELRMSNIKKYLNMSFSSETKEIQFLFLRERITVLMDTFGKNITIKRFSKSEREEGKAVVKLKDGEEKEIFVFDVDDDDKEEQDKKERVLCKLDCTLFGFLNWAMQISDFIEVLEPQSVVDEIEKKVEKLVKRYGIQLKKGEKEHEQNV